MSLAVIKTGGKQYLVKKGDKIKIEKIDGKEMLVCWMGPSCGIQELPTHHNKPMKIA